MSDISVKDVSGVMEAAGGDQGLAIELAQLFLDQTGKELALLEDAVRSIDAAAAGAIAHKCAGSSSTCGMRELDSLFGALEKDSAAGFPSNAEQQLRSIQDEFRAVHCAFEQFFGCSFTL